MSEEFVALRLTCPACAHDELDLSDFESMMVLRSDLALFSLRCPDCKTVFTTLQTIPESLKPLIARAADRIGAGMGAT